MRCGTASQVRKKRVNENEVYCETSFISAKGLSYEIVQRLGNY